MKTSLPVTAMPMKATELKAKIAADHERLCDMERRIELGQRPRFEALFTKARQDITRLEVQLAGMKDACPNCGDEMPPSFLVCRPCLREVPFKLYAAYKGALGQHHHQRITGEALAQTKAAILSHLKQFSTAL